MALDQFHHGVRVVEINEGTRTIRTVATAVIGMVYTSADADAAYFPLDKPVLIANLPAAIAKAGSNGNLKKSLQTIYNTVNTIVIAVRVADGADAAELTSNIIGTIKPDGSYTGLKALERAAPVTSVKPRILCVPDNCTLPVSTALAGMAKKLRAFAYVPTIAETVEAALAYRENFASRELMLEHADWTAWDVAANASVKLDACLKAAAMRALIDKEIGWHKTLSNVGVTGVDGMTKSLFWDLQDPDTEVGLLNANEVTALIQANGFRYWGNRTCSDNPLFCFENYTRTAQVLADTIADAHMWAVDKPMTPTLVKDIIDGIKAKGRELVTGGYLLGFDCWYNEELNDKDTLKAGKLRIDYNYTPVPPLEDLGFQQRITDSYLIDFSARVAAAA
ncbi:phage tail sheath protein [Aeromonas salmonicida]|uniref:phage tail sheath protein n=1 Tax=Aeromonas salmonicida TaxID=645 RepID=UPI003D15E531